MFEGALLLRRWNRQLKSNLIRSAALAGVGKTHEPASTSSSGLAHALQRTIGAPGRMRWTVGATRWEYVITTPLSPTLAQDNGWGSEEAIYPATLRFLVHSAEEATHSSYFSCSRLYIPVHTACCMLLGHASMHTAARTRARRARSGGGKPYCNCRHPHIILYPPRMGAGRVIRLSYYI